MVMMQYGDNKDPRKERDETEYRPEHDTAMEMLGGVILAAIVIAFSVGLYFIVTSW